MPTVTSASSPAAERSTWARLGPRSEEHTSELQSQSNLVCRLLLEKKKKKKGGRRHGARERVEHRSCALEHRWSPGVADFEQRAAGAQACSVGARDGGHVLRERGGV